MPYKNKTTFYKMPVIGYDDTITANDEMIQARIIDGLLYTACFGSTRMILHEGSYSVQFNSEGTGAELVISPTVSSSGYSLIGIINGRLFYSQKALRIGRLVPNITYYVYVEYDDYLESNPDIPKIEFYTEYQENSSFRIPLCIVSAIPGAPFVDTSVDKPNAAYIISHMSGVNNSNPHGNTVRQSNVNILGEMTLLNNSINGSINMTYTTQLGEYELELPENTVPLFVHAFPQSSSAGQIAWRIDSGKVYLSNSGESGITVNLRIEMEAAS